MLWNVIGVIEVGGVVSWGECGCGVLTEEPLQVGVIDEETVV